MVNEWWLVVCIFVCLAIVIWYGRMCYQHGIWDGAFNHFLPIVRKEMRYYDKQRAEEIFKREAE